MLGQNFFSLGPIGVQPPGAATLEIDPGALGELTGSDYVLRNAGGTFTLTNITSGASSTVTVGDSFEGFKITGLALADGETARIQPTRYAAGDLSMAISDPSKVAAANPVASSLASGNEGSVRISDIRVLDTTGMVTAPSTVPNFPSVTLSYDAGTSSFTLDPASGYTPTTIGYDPATDSAGKIVTLTGPGGFSFEFKISGVPADTDGTPDSFTLGTNTGGVADNRNAALLGTLQTSRLLFNNAAGEPTTTLGNAYAQIVTRVGNKTREVQASEAAQEALLAQAKSARDSMSGVNLDEEAANLVRFQQAYQASARVMSVAQTLFDELLAIGR
jgi:flagellar hook-associated protein 1 FlgK